MRQSGTICEGVKRRREKGSKGVCCMCREAVSSSWYFSESIAPELPQWNVSSRACETCCLRILSERHEADTGAQSVYVLYVPPVLYVLYGLRPILQRTSCFRTAYRPSATARHCVRPGWRWNRERGKI